MAAEISVFLTDVTVGNDGRTTVSGDATKSNDALGSFSFGIAQEDLGGPDAINERVRNFVRSQFEVESGARLTIYGGAVAQYVI